LNESVHSFQMARNESGATQEPTHETHDGNGTGMTDGSSSSSASLLKSQRTKTPLPLFQISIAFLIQFAEPVTASVIYPFAPHLVRSTGITGGDETKTGYYVGVIVSCPSSILYFPSDALMV
jgi:hypothetical protein